MNHTPGWLRWLTFGVLVCGAVMFTAPMAIMVLMSLKTPAEIARSTPWALPEHATLANYAFVLSDPVIGFYQKFLNTLVLTIIPTIGTVLTCALSAYPFARIRFPSRDRLFMLLLSTMMLPGAVTLIPSYMMFAKLGWIDTFYPFIIPAFLGGGAFNIFLVRQFMLGIPNEMDEAATIDGATRARIFWQIILPNCKPVLATVAVFSVVGHSRDFLGPSLLLNSPEKQTIEVGLRSLQNAHTTDWHYLMAGSVVVLIPILILFVAAQRFFVQGISLTGGK